MDRLRRDEYDDFGFCWLSKNASSFRTDNTITYEEIENKLKDMGHSSYTDLGRMNGSSASMGDIGFYAFTPGTDKNNTRYWVVDVYQFGGTQQNPRTVCFAAEISNDGKRVDDKIYIYECEDGSNALSVKSMGTVLFKNMNDKVSITLTDALTPEDLVEKANKIY